MSYCCTVVPTGSSCESCAEMGCSRYTARHMDRKCSGVLSKCVRVCVWYFSDMCGKTADDLVLLTSNLVLLLRREPAGLLCRYCCCCVYCSMLCMMAKRITTTTIWSIIQVSLGCFLGLKNPPSPPQPEPSAGTKAEDHRNLVCTRC